LTAPGDPWHHESRFTGPTNKLMEVFMAVTEEQKKAMFEVIKGFAHLIKTLGSVPSGELYARVMGKLSLDSYQAIIGYLEAAELVEVKNHVITWVGK
jgi:hypothetical protein